MLEGKNLPRNARSLQLRNSFPCVQKTLEKQIQKQHQQKNGDHKPQHKPKRKEQSSVTSSSVGQFIFKGISFPEPGRKEHNKQRPQRQHKCGREIIQHIE